MGKRTGGQFERRERDFYPTPLEPVAPLLPFLLPRTRFVEFAAGDGVLIDHLTLHGHICADAIDIEPQRSDIRQQDALTHRMDDRGAVYISNPPWDRPILHQMIHHLSDQAETWMLYDADWMHTIQAGPLSFRCRDIVSVGRVKWIADSAHTGMDNCAWYRFTQPSMDGTRFHFRGPNCFPCL